VQISDIVDFSSSIALRADMSTSEPLRTPEHKSMTDGPQRAFRAAALDRAASPEQLDHVVVITKPADWIFTLVLCIALMAAVLWGIFGRVPTRVSGEGILISRGGKVVDAVSAAAGRLQAVSVAVGDRVSKDQPIAEIVQTDIKQKHNAATEVFGVESCKRARRQEPELCKT
jgi:HlyD family secretion protein